VISPDGSVARVMPEVKPDTHADDVLGVLAAS
jgi:peroxiredoxin